MPDPKIANIEFFKAHLADFLADPLKRNKFVVIHAQSVKGTFDTFEAALQHAVAGYPAAEFVIQQVVDEREVINFIRAAR